MYCAKCGNELQGNESYCPKCGTKTVESETGTYRPKTPAASLGSDILGNIRAQIIVELALLLISFILSLLPTFTVTAGALGISSSESESMFLKELWFLRNFFIIAYILSIGFMAYPVIRKKSYEPRFFIASKITTILILVFFFVFWLILGRIASGLGVFSSLVKVGPSFWGWLFLLTTLTAAVISFKITSNLKQKAIAPPNDPNPHVIYYNTTEQKEEDTHQ